MCTRIPLANKAVYVFGILRDFYINPYDHQHVQVPRIDVLNLISYKAIFCVVGLPLQLIWVRIPPF